MWSPTTASHVSSRVTDTPTAAGAGALAVLGTNAWLGASRTDQTLLWVNGSGGPQDGDLAGGPVYGINPSKSSTDIEVKLIANSGPMTFRYMRNGSGNLIGRGYAVVQDPVLQTADMALSEVLSAPGSVGVLLFNINDDEDVWVATSGIVPAQVLAAGAIAIGAPLICTALGEFTEAGATVLTQTAICLEAVAGAGSQTILVRLIGN